MEDQAHRIVSAGAHAVPLPLAYASPPPGIVSDPDDHDLAVASVLCGLVFMAPVLTGLMSLIFGVSVLLRARRVQRRDFVLAIVGVTLGGLNVVCWILFLGADLWSD
jgi:hypothetical protein